jgi:signal transducer and activator of transcription 5B
MVSIRKRFSALDEPRQQIKGTDRLKQKLALEPPGVVDILPSLNNQITQFLSSSLVTRYF